MQRYLILPDLNRQITQFKKISDKQSDCLQKAVSNDKKDIPEVREPTSLLGGRETEMERQNSSKIYKIGRYYKIKKYKSEM